MSANVAVVIVTYNSASCVGRCLASLGDAGEVVVIDNASSDETCPVVEQSLPGALLIRNAKNAGFAAAVNQGIKATTNPFVLLLNPDCVLRTGLDALVEECLRPEVGAAAGKLVGAGGQAQRGFNVRSFPSAAMLAAEALLINRLWPANPLNRRYRRLDLDADAAQDVDQPAGAFLLVRRDVLEEVGLLDEGFYPIWFEDVDLCLRMRRAGYAIRYIPTCVAGHKGAHSLPALTLEQRHLAWYRNLLRFASKHFAPATCLTLRVCVFLGLACRWAACLFQSGAREEREAYRKALCFVAGCCSLDAPDERLGLPSTVEYKSS